MALVVNAAFSHSTSSSKLISTNRGNQVFGRTGLRVPSLVRKSSNSRPIKCYKGHILPHLLDGTDPTPNLTPAITPETIKRTDFPSDFLFGAASSALQTEGSGTEGGRGPSTWDVLIQDPDVREKNLATDSYYKYKEDVRVLKEMGATAYRFSMSWSRILPDGTTSGKINDDGINFYKDLIKELRENGIEPIVTLFHFDLPQALQNKYNGFLDSGIVDDFKDYAGFCFDTFGKEIKYWTTINEPQYFGSYGYKVGLKKSVPVDPIKDPLIANHHIILAHAAAVQEFRRRNQVGEIGITLACSWFQPLWPKLHPQDIEATERAKTFLMGWYLGPLVNGDYPPLLKEMMGDPLPTFTEEQKKMIKGSFDFVGVNYYTSSYVKDIPKPNPPQTVDDFKHVKETVYRDGVLIGHRPPNGDFNIFPEGLRDVLKYMKDKYSIPKIFITENGIPETRNDTVPLYNAVNDDYRIHFIQHHLKAVKDAMRAGVNVKCYLVWSLLDSLEFSNYYNIRMGLHYTKYKDDYKRVPKNSALWLADFLKTNK